MCTLEDGGPRRIAEDSSDRGVSSTIRMTGASTSANTRGDELDGSVVDRVPAGVEGIGSSDSQIIGEAQGVLSGVQESLDGINGGRLPGLRCWSGVRANVHVAGECESRGDDACVESVACDQLFWLGALKRGWVSEDNLIMLTDCLP